MLNLYLDANILLGFYGLSPDDLSELRKPAVLLRKKKIRLYLPQQTEEEFTRNRPTKIADAMKRFRDQNSALQVPQLARQYDGFETLKRLQNELKAAHAQLLNDVAQDVEKSSLKADIVISELFAHATRVPTSPELLERARTRHDLRNPPGKGDSLGDALNWEALLQDTSDGKQLAFVTDDGDYASPLNDHELHPFLQEEWARRKGSDILFYRRLSRFVSERFPDITLTSDAKKDMLIRRLTVSGSFAETHAVIAQLSSYVDFSVSQRNGILEAATANNQVSLIILDDDVFEFLRSVVRGYERFLDQGLVQRLQAAVDEARSESRRQGIRAARSLFDDDDDLPF